MQLQQANIIASKFNAGVDQFNDSIMLEMSTLV